MASPVMFTNLSLKLFGSSRGRKNQQQSHPPILSTTTSSSSLKEVEAIKLSSNNVKIQAIKLSSNNVKIRSKSRKDTGSKRKWNSREERRRVEDKVEHDVVLVPSDGGYCLSRSESDGSDWSTGWVEPHAPEFQLQSNDDGFAVLVPCYGNNGKKKEKDDYDGLKTKEFSNVDYTGSNAFLEQWLSSLETS